MSRKQARECVFKLIYQFCIGQERDDFTYENILGEGEFSVEDKAYIQSVYDGVLANFDFVKQKIVVWSKDFAFDRIYKVDLAILFVALFELYFLTDIPQNVVINEAVELSKIYSTPKSSAFVNGILASAVKEKHGS